jgi:hypothetical protein
MLRYTGKKIIVAILSVLLAACGGGGGDGSPTADTNPNPGSTTNSTGAGTTGSGTGTPSTSSTSNDATDTGSTSTGTGNTAASPPSDSNATTASFVYDETARFTDPVGITSDAAGNLYVLDRHAVVRKIAVNGSVSTLTGGFGVITPGGLAVDDAGTVYLATSSGAIFKVAADGTHSVLATVSGATQPALDAQGNLFVLASGPNLTKLIERITPAGTVSTLYSGAENVTYQGLAVDSAGNVYTVARANENAGHGRVVKIAPDGTAIDFAAFDFYIRPEDEQPYNVTSTIANITFDSADDLYIAHYRQHSPSPGCGEPERCSLGFFESGMSIDKISPAGVTTRVRTGPPGSTGTLAEYLYDSDYSMSFVTAGIDGNLYVTYRKNNTVYRISQSGEPTLIAGKPGEAGTSD